MKMVLLCVFLLKFLGCVYASEDVVFGVSELGVMQALEGVKNFETQKAALQTLESALDLESLSPRLKMLSVWEISFRTPKTESSNTRFLRFLESISASRTDWQTKFDATMSQLYFTVKPGPRIEIVERLLEIARVSPEVGIKFQALDKALKEGLPVQQTAALDYLILIIECPHPIEVKIKALDMIVRQQSLGVVEALAKLFEIAKNKRFKKEARKEALNIILSSLSLLPSEREWAHELLYEL